MFGNARTLIYSIKNIQNFETVLVFWHLNQGYNPQGQYSENWEQTKWCEEKKIKHE